MRSGEERDGVGEELAYGRKKGKRESGGARVIQWKRRREVFHFAGLVEEKAVEGTGESAQTRTKDKGAVRRMIDSMTSQ